MIDEHRTPNTVASLHEEDRAKYRTSAISHFLTRALSHLV